MCHWANQEQSGACARGVLLMPNRAAASWAFTSNGNITQLRVADETATIILIVKQWDLHRVVATLKPQFKSLVCHLWHLE
jgi:hypothetical protein